MNFPLFSASERITLVSIQYTFGRYTITSKPSWVFHFLGLKTKHEFKEIESGSRKIKVKTDYIVAVLFYSHSTATKHLFTPHSNLTNNMYIKNARIITTQGNDTYIHIYTTYHYDYHRHHPPHDRPLSLSLVVKRTSKPINVISLVCFQYSNNVFLLPYTAHINTYIHTFYTHFTSHFSFLLLCQRYLSFILLVCVL